MFQSPRSGKFESNLVSINGFHTVIDVFQSPRSGKFESNAMKARHAAGVAEMFQSPRSGKFESNNATHTFKTVDDLEDDSVSIP